MSRTRIPPTDEGDVAKRANRGSPGSGGKQVAFRAPDDMYQQLERVADGLGLDISNLVRMILRENINTYVRRVEDIERGAASDDDGTDGRSVS